MRCWLNFPHLLQKSPTTRRINFSPTYSSNRHQSQFPLPRGSRRNPSYNRFNRAKTVKYLWQSSPTFRYGVGAAGAGTAAFIAYNIETVPVSGRRRFNWVSAAYEEQMGRHLYQDILNQYQSKILPSQHSQTRLVRRVLERLIPHSGLDRQEWEVHVIEDPEQMNAFVIPG